MSGPTSVAASNNMLMASQIQRQLICGKTAWIRPARRISKPSVSQVCRIVAYHGAYMQ